MSTGGELRTAIHSFLGHRPVQSRSRSQAAAVTEQIKCRRRRLSILIVVYTHLHHRLIEQPEAHIFVRLLLITPSELAQQSTVRIKQQTFSSSFFSSFSSGAAPPPPPPPPLAAATAPPPPPPEGTYKNNNGQPRIKLHKRQSNARNPVSRNPQRSTITIHTVCELARGDST